MIADTVITTPDAGRLQQPAIKQLVAHLLKEGLVAPDPPKQSPSPATYLIYWRKPQEWAKLLIEYVDDNGLKGSIMTFYEITDGDMKGAPPASRPDRNVFLLAPER